MLATLICFLAMPTAGETTLEPTDDVWVYQFAEDQTTDEYLRVWSGDGQAVGEIGDGHMSFSYSCLKFDTSKVDAKTVTRAKLVLTCAGSASFTLEDSKKNPLEARSLTTDWNEASWAYEKSKTVHPMKDPATIFGGGFGATTNDSDFKIEIDLMKGPADFKKQLAGAQGQIAIALTSTLCPEGQGEGFVYKLYSKSNDQAKRPKLVLSTD